MGNILIQLPKLADLTYTIAGLVTTFSTELTPIPIPPPERCITRLRGVEAGIASANSAADIKVTVVFLASEVGAYFTVLIILGAPKKCDISLSFSLSRKLYSVLLASY
jgi:hypothetical protein